MVQKDKRALLIAGMLLCLLGTLNGLAISSFTNPRLALSAHLAGVQSGMLLLLVALVWSEVAYPVSWLRRATRALAIYGAYGLWLALLLAAALGGSSQTPIANAGHSVSATDWLVQLPLLSGSAATIVALASLVFGLCRRG